MISAAQENRWWSDYNNAAERMFGKLPGDVLTEDEDQACIADANARMDEESA